MNGRKMQTGFFRMVTPALGGKVKWGTTEGKDSKDTKHSGDTAGGGGSLCILGICL